MFKNILNKINILKKVFTVTVNIFFTISFLMSKINEKHINNIKTVDKIDLYCYIFLKSEEICFIDYIRRIVC